MGRFLSPDWSAKAEPVPYAKLDDPQSLNLYSYVLNNPFARIDADGHGCEVQTSGKVESSSPTDVPGSDCNYGTRYVGQLQNGDPTLPTTVQEPPPSFLEKLFTPSLSTALMVATDGLGELPEAGEVLSQAAESGETLLTRYGTKAESTIEKLAGDAANAEEKIGIHGVSTTAKPNLKNPGGTAAKSAVESAFKVMKTGGRNHWTVVLPKPVTDAIVQVFNSIFWP